MSVLKAVQDVTDRIAARSADTRRDYLNRLDAARSRGRLSRGAELRKSGARLCGVFAVRQGKARGQQVAEPRHRHLVQRHAERASALSILSRHHQGGGALDRRDGAGGGRRAGDVRWRDAGPAGHGPVAVQPRRDRDGDGDCAQPQHVRCGGVPRHLRQDRAGPADRGAELRPSAGRLRAGGADAFGHPQRREGAGAPALFGGQGRARRTARDPKPSRTIRRAPAPSTAPPIPTRC